MYSINDFVHNLMRKYDVRNECSLLPVTPVSSVE